MDRGVLSEVVGGACLLLFLGGLVVADVRWKLERRLPNWMQCLLVSTGFALVVVIIGGIATGGDWGATLAGAGIAGGIALAATALAVPPFAQRRR